jgi:Spy/CpxP family protein refolding chaperone
MRKLFLTVALAALVCLPVVAQPFPGGMMGRGGDMSATLLSLEGVQKELKLTDDQKEAIGKATKERNDAFRKAFEDKDFASMPKAGEAFTKAMTTVKDGLKPGQKKRLLGIEVQLAEKNKTVTIFKNAEVVKALVLTDKQKESVKELMSEYEKDAKELFEDAKGDRTKSKGVFQKVQKMGGDTYAKITKSLSEKQLDAWKDLKGEKFEVVFPKGGFNPKGKDKAKKTDDK